MAPSSTATGSTVASVDRGIAHSTTGEAVREAKVDGALRRVETGNLVVHTRGVHDLRGVEHRAVGEFD